MGLVDEGKMMMFSGRMFLWTKSLFCGVGRGRQCRGSWLTASQLWSEGGNVPGMDIAHRADQLLGKVNNSSEANLLLLVQE